MRIQELMWKKMENNNNCVCETVSDFLLHISDLNNIQNHYCFPRNNQITVITNFYKNMSIEVMRRRIPKIFHTQDERLVYASYILDKPLS